MEERLKQVQQRVVQQQEVVHKQEVSALTQEWNTERKVFYYCSAINVVLYCFMKRYASYTKKLCYLLPPSFNPLDKFKSKLYFLGIPLM